MPRLSRICAITVLLLTSGEIVSAIEKFSFVTMADAVVVGHLKLSSYFLSFDGLHVNGTIVATEILYGDGQTGPEFEFHLVVPCSLWDAISGVCSMSARQSCTCREVGVHESLWRNRCPQRLMSAACRAWLPEQIHP